MELQLIRDFIFEVFPKDNRLSFSQYFRDMPTDPHRSVMQGLQWLTFEMPKVPEEGQALFQDGLGYGITLCYALENTPRTKEFLKDYLKACAIQRGENVIDFLKRKKVGNYVPPIFPGNGPTVR